jgi:hypothetical protein
MSVQVVDKRGAGTRKSGADNGDDAALKQQEAPPWFPVFVAFEAERLRQLDKWGDQRGKRLDGTGDPFFVNWANEYKRQNDERHFAGKPGVWSKILLEEVFEALSEAEGPELVKELVQSGAVITAWLEDLAFRGFGE